MRFSRRRYSFFSLLRQAYYGVIPPSVYAFMFVCFNIEMLICFDADMYCFFPEAGVALPIDKAMGSVNQSIIKASLIDAIKMSDAMRDGTMDKAALRWNQIALFLLTLVRICYPSCAAHWVAGNKQ